jgi:hypothetical protein
MLRGGEACGFCPDGGDDVEDLQVTDDTGVLLVGDRVVTKNDTGAGDDAGV